MSPGDDPSSGASSAEKDVTVVMPTEDVEAPGVSPAEEDITAVVPIQDAEAPGVSPAEEDITAVVPTQDAEAPGVSPAEQKVTTAPVTPPGDDPSSGASSAEQDITAVVPAQDSEAPGATHTEEEVAPVTSPGDDPSSGASSAELDMTAVVLAQDSEAPGVTPTEQKVTTAPVTSPGGDPSSGASSAEQDITAVVPAQDSEAPGVTPREQKVTTAPVTSPGDDPSSGASSAEQDITAVMPAQDSEAPGVTPTEEKVTTAPVTSPGDDPSSGASSAEQGMTAVVHIEDEASDISEEKLWDLCLFLHCDPNGRPYKNSDFLSALEELRMGNELVGIGPLTFCKAWLLKVKTRKAWQKLARNAAMRVKGMYCAISVPGERETWMKVCEVPTSRSNLQLERELARRFGRVKRVSCQMWSWREFGKANSTTRYVRLCLKKGLEEKDIPHLWTCFEHERYPIFVTGRPPLCLRCHAVSHLKHECKQPPCTGCDRSLHYSCASSGDGGEPLTCAAEENQKVPVKPGDVQVAPTEACGSEEQSVSNQETAPVVEETPAKEPHEVTGPDMETGSTSTVTRRGSNAEGDITCSSGEAK